MITKIIKDILLENRKGIPIKELNKYLKNNKIDIKQDIFFNKPEIFKLSNGLVFAKQTLLKTKNDFFKVFNDYLEGKVSNKSEKKEIINLFILHLSEELFISWIDINLDKKLLILDLLYSLVNKNIQPKDKIKILFHELIELYSLLTIYTSILSKHYENDFTSFFEIVEKIDPYEETLKRYLFELLTIPDEINKKIELYTKEFKNTENNIIVILENNFKQVNKFSEKLLRRVIKSELNEFNVFYLLLRFDFDSFYEWVSEIIEEMNAPRHNLFNDLDL